MLDGPNNSLHLLLVALGLAVVLGLLHLVANGVLGGGETKELASEETVEGRQEGLPSAGGGVRVLGNVLVGLLGGTTSGLLDGLGDVLGTLLDGLHCEGCCLVT